MRDCERSEDSLIDPLKIPTAAWRRVAPYFCSEGGTPGNGLPSLRKGSLALRRQIEIRTGRCCWGSLVFCKARSWIRRLLKVTSHGETAVLSFQVCLNPHWFGGVVWHWPDVFILSALSFLTTSLGLKKKKSLTVSASPKIPFLSGVFVQNV